jgi:hypothetical protein
MNDVLTTYGFDSLEEFLSLLFHPSNAERRIFEPKTIGECLFIAFL